MFIGGCDLNSKDLFVNGVREEIEKAYSPFLNDDLVIFGTGSYGRMMLLELTNIGMRECVVAFCDNDERKWGTFVDGVLVCSVDRIMELYPNAIYVIASSAYHEILNELKSKQINIFKKSEFLHLVEMQLSFIQNNREHDLVSYAGYWFDIYDKMQREGKLTQYKEKIFSFLEDDESKQIIDNRLKFFTSGDISYIKKIPYEKEMYYSDRCFEIDKNEVFFDCGAYDGDSLCGFINYTRQRYDFVCAFEPDERNYCKLVNLVKENGWKKIELYQVATGKENGIVSFSNDGSGGAKIVGKGDYRVEVVRLDDFIEKKPTLIKMDIEGAELDALRGAENLIKTLKPKLAISIYHKWLDFYDIPLYLKSLVPEYKFKIRHHSKCLYDTVLYAYIQK